MPPTTFGKCVDVHHHIFPEEYMELLKAAGLKLPALQWSPGGSIELMNEHGLAFAFSSISLFDPAFVNRAAYMARLCNEYAAGLCTDHPRRFGMFATLPMPDLAASIAEIDYAIDELDADGVGLMTNYGGKYLGDPLFAGVLEHLDRRHAVVFVHPMNCSCPMVHPKVSSSVLEFPFDTTRTIVSLFVSGAFEKYSKIRFIFCHAGGVVPFLMYRISMMLRSDPVQAGSGEMDFESALRGLYYDLTTAVSNVMLRTLLSVAPLEHVLLGTDYPFVPKWRIRSALDGFSQLDLAGEALESIAYRNAYGLFPRLEALQS